MLIRKWRIAVASAAVLTLLTSPLFAQDDDPPARVARLGYVGQVSLMAAGENEWTDAPQNYTVISGDRVYTSDGARAQLSAGATEIRMWQDSDVTMTNLSDDYEQIGLAQGSIRVRVFRLSPNGVVEVDTPNGAVIVTQPGDYRVDTYAGDGGSAVTVNVGAAQITGAGLDQEVVGGQAVRLIGTNPIQMAPIEVAPFDDLDRWSIARDHAYLNAASVRYVNPDMVGYEDLDANGDWSPTPEYGAVWYPRSMPVGWRPYTYGHWGYTPAFGYTWVDDAPWGFAPFHYGRWVQVGPRWGWVPGPREVAPVYSPALVSFVGGGPGISIGIHIGGGGGGIAAWFPLGVGEPYVPWYHCSPRYVRQVNVTNVNITNIHNTTIINNYNTFITNTRNVRTVNDIRVNNINYAHRDAVVAVPANSFASGRRVDQVQARLTAAQTQQLAKAPVVVGRAPVAAPSRPIRQVRSNVAAPVARPALMTPHGVVKADPRDNRAPITRASLPKPHPATALPKPAPGAVKPVMGAGARPTTHPPVAPVARPGTPAEAAKPGTPAAGAKPGAPAAGAKPAPPAAGARPGTPAEAKPETPAAGARPGTTPVRPGTPEAKPGAPAPGARPGTPPARPGTPEAKPGTPAPGARPGAPQPGARPGTPPARPGNAPETRPAPGNRPAPPEANRPGTRPVTPETRPAPGNRPAIPETRPAPPQANRPAARPATPETRPSPGNRPAPPEANRPGERPAAPANRPAPPAARPVPQARPGTQPPPRNVAPPANQKRPPTKEEQKKEEQQREHPQGR